MFLTSNRPYVNNKIYDILLYVVICLHVFILFQMKSTAVQKARWLVQQSVVVKTQIYSLYHACTVIVTQTTH